MDKYPRTVFAEDTPVSPESQAKVAEIVSGGNMQIEEARELKDRMIAEGAVLDNPGLYEGIGVPPEPVYYISGPMTGFDGFNYEYFNTIARMLRNYGHQVINPAENFDGDSSRHRSEYMRLDVQHVLYSTDIVLLPNWQQSSGARLEAEIALQIGLNIWSLVEHRGRDEVLFACEMQPYDLNDLKRDLYGTYHPHAFNRLGEPLPAPAKPLPILEEAAEITSKDRQQVYGHPRQDFQKTVGMWNAVFERKLVEPFDERDFCVAMMCVKMSRLQKTPEHRDSLLDIVGYARCYEMVQESMDADGS
jgi:hypothetical protein